MSGLWICCDAAQHELSPVLGQLCRHWDTSALETEAFFLHIPKIKVVRPDGPSCVLVEADLTLQEHAAENRSLGNMEHKS